MDPGAEKSVCGLNQAQAYCRMTTQKLNLAPSPYTFKFGDGSRHSLGHMTFRMPSDQNSFISLSIDVVDADIPLLIGLDVLDKANIYVDNVHNRLVHGSGKWFLPLERKRGHLFLPWTTASILFTRKELQKLHEHFFHPSAEKLYNLVKRARPQELSPQTRQTLDDISRACRSCKLFTMKPYRFRVSIPDENIIFNQEVALDLMFIDRTPILHIVDTHTHYQNAIPLKGESAADVWEAFVEAWASMYAGFPSKIRADQGSIFTSNYWRKCTEDVGIELQLSGVASHNSIGVGERYHGPLRRVFRSIRDAHPSIDPELALRYAVKGINDTSGPEGLVPSLLVYGMLPRFPTPSSSLPDQEHRMRALETARREMSTITSRLRIQQALRAKLPPATRYLVTPGDRVFVYQERRKAWTGPYTVHKIHEKEVFVHVDGALKHFNLSQVLPDPATSGDKEIERLLQATSHFTSKGGSGHHAYITEVLHPRDPRRSSDSFQTAKAKELEGLAHRGVYEIVCYEDIKHIRNPNILGGRFVLSIKNSGTHDEVYKARFVVQGHTDIEKNMLVHNSTNLKQNSIRVLVALASIFGFSLWSQDVSQAYLQSAEKLMREVYVRPNKEFGLRKDQLLHLLKPLYGLSDAGDYWHATFSRHLRDDLCMMPTAGDLSLFIKKIHGQLHGIIGTHVDDTLAAGNNSFEEHSRKTERTFESKARTYTPFTFAGIEIEDTKDGYVMHQSKFAVKINFMPQNATFPMFRSKRQELAWLTHTRPDVSADVNLLAQVTEAQFNRHCITDTNRLIKRIHHSRGRGLIQHRLNKSHLKIKVFSDSSFANTPSSHSQLGYLILLCDNTNRCNVIHFSSYKSRRVVRSVMGAELYAFADAFDLAFLLKTDLETMLSAKVPLIMMIDSDSVFKVIVKNTSTTEKRLMIDIRAAREAYESQEISDVGWIRGSDNPADGLTKPGRCEALENILDRGLVNIPVQQWVVRTALNKTSSGETYPPCNVISTDFP